MSDALPVPTLPLVVQQYLDGASIQDLAAQHQKCHRTIYNWLLRECGTEYEHVVTQALIARIADADWQLEMATAPIQIARAREQAKFARMDFERRRPKLYGPKQEVNQDTTIRVLIEPIPSLTPPQVIEIQHNSSTAPQEGAGETGSQSQSE